MQKTTFIEGNNWKKTSLYFEPEDVDGDGETPVVVEAEPVEVPLSLSQNFGQTLLLRLLLHWSLGYHDDFVKVFSSHRKRVLLNTVFALFCAERCWCNRAVVR